MKKTKKPNRIIRILKIIYARIVRINDSPQKVALGFGLGAFLGILPGTGPLAALFLAYLLRVNRASALLGSLITNTWLSVILFLLSVKIGSGIIRVDGKIVTQDWQLFVQDFQWRKIFQLSAFKIALPVVLGYLVMGIAAGVTAYVLMLTILKLRKK